MATADSLPVLDREEGLRRVRGNTKLYRELVGVFLSDLPRLMVMLRSALENRTEKDVHLAAHSLKGSASHLGAVAVSQRAWILEEMAQDGDLTDGPGQFLLLEQDLQQLTLVLQSLASEAAADA